MSTPELLYKKKKLLPYIVLLIPAAIYLNTLFNDFALDDSIVITDNVFVKKGFDGIKEIFSTESFTGFFKQKKELVQGSRYRPLSIATFAVEYALWGMNPGLSHLINLILYCLLCLVLFRTLQQILLLFGVDQKSIPIAFIATLIWAMHPIHTEVVANIKGRDEVLAVLFLMLSIQFFLRYVTGTSLMTLLWTGIFLFLALLSKENALTALPMAFLLLLMIYPRNTFKNSIIGLLVVLTVAAIYLWIRWKVAGAFSGIESDELMNNPFLNADSHQKTATIFYTLLLYLKLLFFPHPLTYDYYPYHIELYEWSNIWVVISAILHFILILIGILNIRKNRILSFGILFYCITLFPVSNLLVNIGSFMNERFLFLPSIGFVLLAGSFFVWLFSVLIKPWQINIVTTLLVGIAIVFSVLTIIRNTQWKDNYTLFTHDVKISKNSAKGNCTAGGILLERAQNSSDAKTKKQLLKQSETHLSKALEIYPNYIDALLLEGNVQYEMDQDIEKVLIPYKKLLSLSPGYELALNNLKKMLASSQNANQRKLGYTYILKQYPNDFEANYQLGVTYGKMTGQLDSSILYLRQALREEPENTLVNRDLGVAYAMSGKYKESLPLFKNALKLNSNDPDNYINLGITYQKLGRVAESQAMFSKAETIKQSMK
jgi:tetratricopeptide (TPR) repeat protein